MNESPEIQKLLETLHAECQDVQASALLSADGMMQACHIPSADVCEDKVAAMSAAMLSVGDRMIRILLDGITERIVMQGNVGAIVITSVSPDSVLTVLVNNEQSLGMLYHQIKEFSKNLQYLQYGVSW